MSSVFVFPYGLHKRPKGVVCKTSCGNVTKHLRPRDMYFFISFGSLHTKKNLGVCVVEAATKEEANQKCIDLDLMPQECNQARAYGLSEEDFQKQGLVLNRFYTSEEMESMGFQKD